MVVKTLVSMINFRLLVSFPSIVDAMLSLSKTREEDKRTFFDKTVQVEHENHESE